MNIVSSAIMIMSAPSLMPSENPWTSVPLVTYEFMPSLLTMASTDWANPPMTPSPDVMGTTATLNEEKS